MKAKSSISMSTLLRPLRWMGAPLLAMSLCLPVNSAVFPFGNGEAFTFEGSWADDWRGDFRIYIGEEGTATASGLTRSPIYAPVDFTDGPDTPTITLRAAPGEDNDPWTVTLFDTSGESFSLEFAPISGAGVFRDYNTVIDTRTTAPWMNWTEVNRFTVSGNGSEEPFTGSFQRLTVIPEPSTYAAVCGLGLVGFALVRRLRARNS